MEAPIYSRLKKYFDSDKISFAMPGHKNGRGLNEDLLCCDVTELDSTLNLFSDDETITQANSLLSAVYGSDKSYILTWRLHRRDTSDACGCAFARRYAARGFGLPYERYKYMCGLRL